MREEKVCKIVHRVQNSELVDEILVLVAVDVGEWERKNIT
jgi:hypothetical protein